MKRFFIRLKCNIQKRVIDYKESNYDFVRFDLGTNSISLSVVLFIGLAISFKTDVLNWNYLKGLNNDLSFFIGLFSMILGVGFYKYWNLGDGSVYTVHFLKTKYMPEKANIIFTNRDFSFGIGRYLKTSAAELSPTIRQLFCIGIFFSLALISLDNGGIDKLKKFPAEMLASSTGFCPDEQENIEKSQPIEGCELIIRAFELGYAKDLGTCAPEIIDPDKMEICQKRRNDEPYLHFMSRLMVGSYEKQIKLLNYNNRQRVVNKFKLQLKNLEVLRDYQVYAITASPRASHHIWTDLPYPENVFIENYREIFQPSYCIKQFQNQTNTVRLERDDHRLRSKLLEHVYGQLLFNPKSRISVGSCKEYRIHWNSQPDICDRLAQDPTLVLENENVLADAKLVLKRHDIAIVILGLEDEIQKIEQKLYDIILIPDTPSQEDTQLTLLKTVLKPVKKIRNKIIKNKIAKDKQQLRNKNALVSFQCFMQAGNPAKDNYETDFTLGDTNFVVKTRYFPQIESMGDSQISMYREFSKLLEINFHYSQLSSRSDVKIKTDKNVSAAENRLLEEPTYLLTRLEMLKNVDVFLGNSWVLERDDLLGVYPYHVHLQNYVKQFRSEYHQNRGRL